VNSEEDVGDVTGQQPPPGTVVVEGTRVRINVSKGPRPVEVPNVVNLPYERAASELQADGFGVRRVDVSSDLGPGIVVDQDPSAGAEASRGTTVTLEVSRGPSTVAVPDVTFQDVTIARATLESAGFRVREELEDTSDPGSDGIVLAQDPVGNSQAEPGSLVTLFVGRLVETEPPPTTEPATGDETVPTEP
jgi:serine/threonine-protein kinase